jgi:trk system potassium uptake protein TrkA
MEINRLEKRFCMKNIFKKESQGLRIIIVGCGKVGVALLEQLCKEGHDITIIDTDAQKIQDLTNMYDVMGITGNGASYSVQVEAGIATTDLLIAVTGSDELNLLCCTIASQVADCSSIARVRTPDYSEEVGYLREKLGLAMITNPELEAAKEAARILSLPTALEVNTFAKGEADLIRFKIPRHNVLDGITVADVGRDLSNDLLVCAIEREGTVYIPSGNFVLKEDDSVSIVATRSESRNFLKKIGFETKQVKNTMIVGGGNSAFYLAKELINMGISVKIIERDAHRCEELSILLPKAVIINGDGTDEALLKEEGLESVESFVPLMGIDEENILLTLYAKQVSKAKVITKINRINFTDVVKNLDLGSVIYPRYITAEAIIAYVRAKKNSMNSNIETLYYLFNSRVEAIEFHVEQENEVTGVPLKDLKLKDNLLICFISRNGKVIIPDGQDDIQVGDNVMIVTTHTGLQNLEDIRREK